MKPLRLIFARAVRALGALLLSASAFTLVAWVQSRDPECALGEAGSGALLQLRLCEPYIDGVQGAPWWQLGIIAAAALLGWGCMRCIPGRRADAAWPALSVLGRRVRRESALSATATAGRR